jgi:hypothetical protein
MRPAEAGLRLLLGLLWATGCGPQFPPSWLIPAKPSAAGGGVDPAGQLRVLAIVAEPPEVTPGAPVAVSALVVTHPLYGVASDLGGELAGRLVRTPTPRGLSLQWRVCRMAAGASALLPCGLVPGQPSVDEQLLLTLPGGTTQLLAPAAADLPYTLVLTLIAADEAFPGGAAACREQAVQLGGVSPEPNHCVLAVKRLQVAASSAPTRNPALGGLYLGASAAERREISAAAGDYPRLPADLSDSARPSLSLWAERAAAAVQTEPDPQHPEQQRPETLGVAFFTTSGTLAAGRGSFLDQGCAQDPTTCPQAITTDVSWQPPTAQAAVEAPDGVVFFFAVLRDDRGGTSFRLGRALAR